ncbi:MAG: tRNA (guanosine(46)-N7)-methyltransferase TrmB [Pseudobdellovibrionaceae bacterium]|jgi:tRNA (guanine-N7-)-methyltransferase|nr:tRNA (guanosine(46)-N7)-methyltransferase TrmB [Pseudomonadota bacterium]
MSEQNFKRPRLSLTRNIPAHNEYTKAIDVEYRDFAFNEERAPENRGRWRKDVFQVNEDAPVDLEIGTGNGNHFKHRSLSNPDRMIVGLELKYKPLIQSIRGCLREGAKNARICRYHAMNVDLLFEKNELNNIYIHFPDPWVSPRKPKNRFVNRRVLDLLYELQQPGSHLEFKTDSREYFLWSLEQIKESKYSVEFKTLNLHSSEKSKENFITQFERIFMRQGVEINYILLRKPHA